MTNTSKIMYKLIPNFPDYCIGTDGSIYSKRGWDTWIQLTPWKDSNGYLQVYLCDDNGKHVRAVHRLVLETFVGPCPPGMECRHYPCKDKDNVKLENLSWTTNKQNAADRNEQNRHNKGERNGSAFLTEKEVLEIRELVVTTNLSYKEIGDQYDVSPTLIGKITRRENWKHLP